MFYSKDYDKIFFVCLLKFYFNVVVLIDKAVFVGIFNLIEIIFNFYYFIINFFVRIEIVRDYVYEKNYYRN